ncbi:MAG TPA: hypothetical protein VI757_09745 [Bacteroidia bacterium]|nr:hypothetical protein [Bacteroidia bacterium]
MHKIVILFLSLITMNSCGNKSDSISNQQYPISKQESLLQDSFSANISRAHAIMDSEWRRDDTIKALLKSIESLLKDMPSLEKLDPKKKDTARY